MELMVALYDWLARQVEFRTIDAMTAVQAKMGRPLTPHDRAALGRELAKLVRADIWIRTGPSKQKFVLSGGEVASLAVKMEALGVKTGPEEHSGPHLVASEFRWPGKVPTERELRKLLAEYMREMATDLQQEHLEIEGKVVRAALLRRLGYTDTVAMGLATHRPISVNRMVNILGRPYEDFLAYGWLSLASSGRIIIEPRKFIPEYDMLLNAGHLDAWLQHMSTTVSAWGKLPKRTRERMDRSIWLRAQRFTPKGRPPRSPVQAAATNREIELQARAGNARP